MLVLSFKLHWRYDHRSHRCLTSFSWYCNATRPPVWCGHDPHWPARCLHCRRCWRWRPAPSWALGWGAGGWCVFQPSARGSTQWKKRYFSNRIHIQVVKLLNVFLCLCLIYLQHFLHFCSYFDHLRVSFFKLLYIHSWRIKTPPSFILQYWPAILCSIILLIKHLLKAYIKSVIPNQGHLYLRGYFCSCQGVRGKIVE